MKVSIPGFPVGSSVSYDLPDIGELLLYPAFQGISADDYRTCATEFQRYLLDCMPLRNDRKYVLVRSGVWLLQPGTRSHVGRNGDWHIDGIANDDHIVPQERVHILCSNCGSLTEFNLNSLEIESPPGETRTEFARRIRCNPQGFGVVAQPIEPCRIYTFENHLHRAVEPDRIEFRFFLRVRETDERPFNTGPLDIVTVKDIHTGKVAGTIRHSATEVTIDYPTTEQWTRRPDGPAMK